MRKNDSPTYQQNVEIGQIFFFLKCGLNNELVITYEYPEDIPVRHFISETYLMLNDILINLHEISTGKNISIMWDQDFIEQNTVKSTCRLSAVITAVLRIQ